MKITDIKTYLMRANVAGSGGWRKRNWLFGKVFTDEVQAWRQRCARDE